MSTLLELRNEAAEALEKAKGLAGGDDEAAYNAAFEDFESKRKKVERVAAMAAQEKTFTDAGPKPSEVRNPRDADWIPEVSADAANRNPSGHVKVGDRIFPVATKDCEGWIRGYPVAVQHPSILARLSAELRTEKDLQEQAFAAFFRRGAAWVAKNKPELVQYLNALQEDSDTEGGYLVPTDQRFEVLRNPGAPGGVTRPISTSLTTSRDGGTMPSATSVTWASIAEEASNTDSDPAFGQVAFTIHKSGANNRLSMELLADSAVNIPALLGVLYGESLGRYEDQQAIEGDGATEPLGLRTAGAGSIQGTISSITDVWADPPTALEIVKAYFELPAQWRGRAIWHLTSSIMSKIVTTGSAAAGIHFIPDDQSMALGFPMQLLGRPVVIFDGTGWDDAATISGGEKIGAFGDFNQYYFIDRLGMTVARSDDIYFTTDQVAFKARVRYDSLFGVGDAFRLISG